MDRKDELQQLLEDICYCLHKHETQHWKDCPGTDAERMHIALGHAREALFILKNPDKLPTGWSFVQNDPASAEHSPAEHPEV